MHKQLRKIALRSEYMKFRNGTMITNPAGEVVSVGWSHNSQHVYQEVRGIHSELHALARARHRSLEGYEAWNMAISMKSGNVTMSRPCIVCAVALKAAGINTVHYTVRGGTFLTVDLEAELQQHANFKVYKNGKAYR